MRKIGAVLAVVAILVVGLGFYRGWFAFSSPAPEAGSNTVNANFAADPDKMKQDAETVKDAATELTGGVKADGQTNDIVKSNEP